MLRFRASRRKSALQSPHAATEAYRVLRSSLAVALADLERPTVLVTSALPGEGKTSTAVHLARTMAEAGQRVAFIDLDLRHPTAHRVLGAHNERGVTDVLLESDTLNRCLQYVDITGERDVAERGMYFLSPGRDVSNPSELLLTNRMRRLLDSLSSSADVVLIDTPPVLPVADALVIGRMVAGAVLVVEARRTPIPVVQQAKDALTRNQTRLLGVVVNKDPSEATSRRYGYDSYTRPSVDRLGRELRPDPI